MCCIAWSRQAIPFILAFAVALRFRNVKDRSASAVTGITAIVGGVTEPALFGFILPYKRPMIGIIAGGFAGGLLAGIFKVNTYVLTFCYIQLTRLHRRGQ